MTNTHTQGEQHSKVTKLLTGRVVLVTGASRGIGAATAKLLARHGAVVGVNYHSSESTARQVVNAIKAEGGNALAVKADLKEPHKVKTMVQQVTEAFGPVDTLILNANISFAIAPFLEHRWEDFQEKVVGELKAAFYPCQAVVSSMVEKQQGCIIAVSSVTSRYPYEGFCALSTAKSGLDGFLRSLALELGPHGIRVNTVSPGEVLTDATSFKPKEWEETNALLTPLRRNGQPEDVAGAIVLLASEEARFITGTHLPVDGGTRILSGITATDTLWKVKS